MAKKVNRSDKNQLNLGLDAGLTEADLYSVLRTRRHTYKLDNLANLLVQVDEGRTKALAEMLTTYITTNLPKAINKRNNLNDYRTNPYVLLTSASVLKLSDPAKFGTFLFNNKLYAGLETSFGKSIEAAFIGHYPIVPGIRGTWEDAQEKVAEFTDLKKAKLSREQKARARNNSIWREIDKSCIINDRRYLVSIKSGPNCINDTQVAGMVSAIRDNYKVWMQWTRQNYPEVTGLDIVVGITYGTDLTTNNKENQILAKLQEHGFTEEDRLKMPGVLIDESGSIRLYRCIGQDFWAFIGSPANRAEASFVFLEVLLALSQALSQGMKKFSLEDHVNLKLTQLAKALLEMRFPRQDLPHWIREDFSEDELFWLATAMTAFYDTGI